MYAYFRDLAEQIELDVDKSTFNTHQSIDAALRELSEEYDRMTPVAKHFTSSFVWSIVLDTHHNRVKTESEYMASIYETPFKQYGSTDDGEVPVALFDTNEDHTTLFIRNFNGFALYTINIQMWLDHDIIQTPDLQSIFDAMVHIIMVPNDSVLIPYEKRLV